MRRRGIQTIWPRFGVAGWWLGGRSGNSGNCDPKTQRFESGPERHLKTDETPQGGQCTTRSYAYDADSNRTSLTTRSPGVGGICSESGGTPQEYKYDAADRLEGPTYDSWGRITSLPATYAGGKTLTTGYFSNDMVATQSQGGVSNMFQLDASLRQRQRLQGGGLEGTEVFHYDGPWDSPAWTVRGSVWTRNIAGIGGELAAVQESGKEIILQLTDLHGDVSATASISPEVSSLKAISTFDEFGSPTSGSAGRFGWLGGKGRRTELSSGVIQMGRRSYVPQLGRFLTPDPVLGGSANPYDYANQDPVNKFDLSGECADQYARHGCRRGHNSAGNRATSPQYYKRKAHRIEQAHHHADPVVTSRKCTAIACTVGWPSGGKNDGFIEHVANSVIHYLTHHNAATSYEDTARYIESIYGASNSYAGGLALGCAQGATEGWNETAEMREAYPDGAGFFPSILITVAKCVAGSQER